MVRPHNQRVSRVEHIPRSKGHRRFKLAHDGHTAAKTSEFEYLDRV